MCKEILSFVLKTQGVPVIFTFKDFLSASSFSTSSLSLPWKKKKVKINTCFKRWGNTHHLDHKQKKQLLIVEKM